MRQLAHRYPWTLAFAILFVAMLAGFFRTEHIANERADETMARRADNLARDKQFCRALPAATAAAAESLVKVSISLALRRGESLTEIEARRELGRLYVADARQRVINTLPECQKILP